MTAVCLILTTRAFCIAIVLLPDVSILVIESVAFFSPLSAACSWLDPHPPRPNQYRIATLIGNLVVFSCNVEIEESYYTHGP